MSKMQCKISMNSGDYIESNIGVTKMSIDDNEKYFNDESYKTAKASISFLSTRPNSHKIEMTEDMLKEYAKTFLGEFIIAEYSEIDGDVTTHTDEQKIVGYIPENQELVFETALDGYIDVKCEAIISKLYANDVYELFKQTNFRNVSVEMMTWYETDGLDLDQFKNADGEIDLGQAVGKVDLKASAIDGCGITILGLAYKPSVPNANITITQMSKVELEEEYIKMCSDSVEGEQNDMSKTIKLAVEIGDTLWSKVYDKLRADYPYDDGDGYVWRSEYSIQGIYEEGTDKYIIASKEENLYKIDLTYTEDDFEFGEIKEVEQVFVEKMSELLLDSKDVEIHELKMSQEYFSNLLSESKVTLEEKNTEIETSANKLEETNTQLSEIKSENETLKDTISKLEEFKSAKESADKENAINSIMMSVSKVYETDSEDYNKFKELGDACKFEDLETFKNQTLAKIGEVLLSRLEQKDDDGIVENIIMSERKEASKSIYDMMP